MLWPLQVFENPPAFLCEFIFQLKENTRQPNGETA
jgi:hypothetical protein